MLARAVNSVLDQKLSEGRFEVIVVNDSGRELPAAEWQQSPMLQVVSTWRRERCVARNTGAAIARGEYLLFLDDDDWLLPGALERLCLLAKQKSEAAWLYGSVRIVDEEDNCLARPFLGMDGNCFTQTMAGEWIPLQASAIRSNAFFAVGGFDPHLAAAEDVDLARRIAHLGDFACTANDLACVQRGATWVTSSDWARHNENSRRAREGILNSTDTLTRMLKSAPSPYWHGRIVRAYWSSALWNIQHRDVFTAIGRGALGLWSFALAGRYVAARSFWRATGRAHVWTTRNDSSD